MEHESWLMVKSQRGWKLGKPRNDIKRTHSSLVSWEELPEDEMEKNRQIVRRIPEYLSTAGFEIYPL